MDAIGTTIGKYILPPALQKMANFMKCIIQQFETFSSAVGSDVNGGELENPSTNLAYTEIMPMGALPEGQKMFRYCHDFWHGEENGVNSTVTGTGTGMEMQQISQASGLWVLGSKEFNSIVNTAPNIIQNAEYIQTSLENLVSTGNEVGKRAEIIKMATGETYAQYGQIFTYFGQIWGEETNKALEVLHTVPYRVTKPQSEITADLLNMPTVVNKTVAMAKRNVEINDTLSSLATSVGFSLPSVENYGEVGGATDTKMSLGTSDENLKYIRDVAQREAINNHTTAQIAVDFTNNSTINSDLDIDLVMNKFTEKLREAVDTCAEGVNYCV